MSNGLYKSSFFTYFRGLKDLRQKGKVWHPLTDILFIVTSGIICGYDDWDTIHEWASAPSSQEWLKKHIALTNGTPSLSTIKRAFGILNPKEFATRFIDWMKVAVKLPDKDVISVDGKTSKGSRDPSKEQKAIHIVSAFCASHGLVIGQTKTSEKSNEITAIPELLDELFIEGCIVTIDAMGLQKKIVKKIVTENKADYVINLKGNQETLQQEVQKYYEHLEEMGKLKSVKTQSLQQNTGGTMEHKGIGFKQTLDNGHGRIEKRTYFYSTDIEWMIDAKRDWEKLTGIGAVIREVEYKAYANKKTIETAYYVGSVDNVIDFARATRTHWGVESMHWSLDVTFGDDHNQTREKTAAQNLANVKRMVFNTLKNENTIYPNKSKPKKRIAAATDPEYRDRLINLNFQEH